MQEVDWNWARLKEQQQTKGSVISGPQIFKDCEQFKVDRWMNNPKNYKLTYRQGTMRFSHWFDYREHKSLWRSNENRIWEELQYQYRQQEGIAVTRQTARTEHYENLINIKMIEVQHFGRPVESILIVDGTRLLAAKPFITKDKYSYSYQ